MFDSERKTNGNEENLIRRFSKSLFRRLRHSGAPQDDDKSAAAGVQLEPSETVNEPMNRIAKQGSFYWGSFFAFEDGSIEVERAGVRQRFRNFSELKRSLRHKSEDEGSTAETLPLGS
jgi:hypothetical protein